MAREKKPRDKNGNIITGQKSIKDPLLEPYHVTMDQYGFTVQETTLPKEGSKDGTVYVKPVGHYSSLSGCLERVAKIKINEKQCYTSIKENINEWKKLNEEIKQSVTI